MNSRAKGQRFERQMCKELGKWWGCEFKRTPLSGGWAKETLVGDITPTTTPEFPWLFSVECKDQEAWSIDAYLRNGDKSPLAAFLEQCVNDAKQKNLVPLLIAKSKNVKPLCFMPFEMAGCARGTILFRGRYFTIVRLDDLTCALPAVVSASCANYIRRTYSGADPQPEAPCPNGAQALNS